MQMGQLAETRKKRPIPLPKTIGSKTNQISSIKSFQTQAEEWEIERGEAMERAKKMVGEIARMEGSPQALIEVGDDVDWGKKEPVVKIPEKKKR